MLSISRKSIGDGEKWYWPESGTLSRGDMDDLIAMRDDQTPTFFREW